MVRRFVPDGVAPPASRYSHGAEVGAGARWLYVAGQIGVDPGGAILQGVAAQAAQCFKNIDAVLAGGGMDRTHLVSITVYAVEAAREEAVAAYREARDAWLDGYEPPAATFLIVSGLAHPDLLIEIEAVAAAD
ncbi:MAG: RidA family protein [Pseudomonadota bacterium]